VSDEDGDKGRRHEGLVPELQGHCELKISDARHERRLYAGKMLEARVGIEPLALFRICKLQILNGQDAQDWHDVRGLSTN
jgi:hypothetical protein